MLAYHDVLPLGAAPFPYAVGVRRFRAHLDVLARCGARVVGLAELCARLDAGHDVDGCVAIAFDDALVGVHRHALPELASRGWPAALHPVVDRLGVSPPWWPGSQRTMTLAEVQEAADAGVELAAHGATHACLPCLSDADLAAELLRSRLVLGQISGDPPRALAYPFGHHDARVRKQAAEAGFSTGWTFLNGRVGPGTDHYRLPRLTMHQGLGPARLAMALARRAKDWPDTAAPVVHPAHEASPAARG